VRVILVPKKAMAAVALVLGLGTFALIAAPVASADVTQPVVDQLPNTIITLPGVTVTKIVTLPPRSVTIRSTVTQRVTLPRETVTRTAPGQRVTVTSMVPAPGLSNRTVVTLPRRTYTGATSSSSKSGTIAVTKTLVVSKDRVIVPEDRIVIKRSAAAGVSIGLVVLGILLAIGTMWGLYALGYLNAEDRNTEKMEELVKEVKTGEIGPPE
jgi:hypothetical protein